MLNQKMALLRSKVGRKAMVVAAFAAPVLAHAQSSGGTTDVFDPSTYVASITGTIAGMLAIGGAVFALTIAIKSTKWARKAL